MALAATHIRFALDTRKKYTIQNLEQYISGTIYPDSRYFTKIDRGLTHNSDILLESFATSDFKKGWQVHCLCDIMQAEKMKELFSDLLIKDGTELGWIKLTAIKVLEDMFDMQEFDLQGQLNCLEYIENPNGENIHKVRQYYDSIIKKIYQGKKVCAIEDYKKSWEGVDLDPRLIGKVVRMIGEFSQNPAIMKKVKSLYGLMAKE